MTNLLEFNDSSKIDIDDFAAYVIRLQSTDGQNKYPKNIREEVDKIHQEFSARTKSEIFVCKMNKVQSFTILFVAYCNSLLFLGTDNVGSKKCW